MRKDAKGFTLIELVMVIVILGVLAAVAIPVYVNLQSEANTAAEKGVVGGVRAGIQTYFVDTARGNRASYPASLDSATNGVATKTNALFVTVLTQGGVTADWTRGSATAYTGPASTVYTYNSTDGSFK